MATDKQKHPEAAAVVGILPSTESGSRLERAVRQMIEVEAGQRPRPEGGSVEIVDDPDIGGIRRGLGMTQQEMAAMLDLPVGTLRNWEQGRRKPSNAGRLVLRLLSDMPRAVPDEAPGAALGNPQIVRTVAENAGLSLADAQSAIEAFLDAITSQLRKGDDVRLVGFGNFSVSHKAATTARNPQTGAPVNIPSRKVPKFTPGKGLKDTIN